MVLVTEPPRTSSVNLFQYSVS